MVGGCTLRDITRDMFDLVTPNNGATVANETTSTNNNNNNNKLSSRSLLSLYDEDIPCTVCGRDISNSSKSALGWVRCSSCKERMHASCALYKTEAEMIRALSFPDLLCPAERCPCCAVQLYADKPIPSRATLIIAPPAILDQWSRKIQRHTTDESLRKVLIYPRIKKLCVNTISRSKVDRSLVHPKSLVDADIVLTTFPAIMTDLSHSGENPVVVSNM
mmetsp:Transcript_2216/g.3519  ORF Transcript_2216/g.3519 Transcript_2216/m.3519 type:complete len:219 (+) Transcript_2216:2017-2673(+)